MINELKGSNFFSRLLDGLADFRVLEALSLCMFV
jgi:hypothetical protein